MKDAHFYYTAFNIRKNSISLDLTLSEQADFQMTVPLFQNPDRFLRTIKNLEEVAKSNAYLSQNREVVVSDRAKVNAEAETENLQLKAVFDLVEASQAAGALPEM